MKSKNSNKLIAILNKNSNSALNVVKFCDSRNLTNDTTKHKHVTINNINSRLTLYTKYLDSYHVDSSLSSLINITNEFNSRILGTDDLNKLYVENYSNSRFFIRNDGRDTSNLPVSYCNFQRNGNIYIKCEDEFNKCLIDHTYITSEEQKITDLNWYSLTIDSNDVVLENIFNGYISFNNFRHAYSTLSSIKSISNVDCTICISPTNDLKIENISLANLAINQNYYPEEIPTISFTNINNAYITGYKRDQILTDINGMNGVNSIIRKINLKNSKKISLNNCKITTTDYNIPLTILTDNYTEISEIYTIENLTNILSSVTQYDSNIKHSSYFHTHYQLNPLNKTGFYDNIFSGYISKDIINFKVGPNEEKLFVKIGDILFGTTTKTNFRRCDGSKLSNSFEDQFSTDYTYDYYINMGTWQLPTVGAVQIEKQFEENAELGPCSGKLKELMIKVNHTGK